MVQTQRFQNKHTFIQKYVCESHLIISFFFAHSPMSFSIYVIFFQRDKNAQNILRFESVKITSKLTLLL